MGVYFTYAFFAGFGSDKHNYFNVITFGYGAVLAPGSREKEDRE